MAHACKEPGCSYVCMEAPLLRQHHRQHTGERPFSCTECPSVFSSRSAKTTHEKKLHAKPSDRPKPPRLLHRPFTCTAGSCALTFSSALALRKHARIHGYPEKLISCAEPGCAFAAKRVSALVAHSRAAGHPALACPAPGCPSRFTTETSLLRHRRGPAHAGAGGEPLCIACGRAFATVAVYLEHVKDHRLQNLEKIAVRKREAAAQAARELLLGVQGLAGAGAV
jgi:KRAB domain-containing zinc finger protein